MKFLIMCILSGLITGCVQNKHTSLPHTRPNLAHLGSGYYQSFYSNSPKLHGGGTDHYDYNHDGAFDRDDQKNSRDRDDSSTRQRQFISDNGESLRSKLESKKQ